VKQKRSFSQQAVKEMARTFVRTGEVRWRFELNERGKSAWTAVRGARTKERR
jgi:hypothetical protein